MSKVPKPLKIIISVLGGLVVLMIIVTIASGSGKKEDNKTEQTAQNQQAQTTSSCESVSELLVSTIQEGANTKGITLRNAKAVKSKDFESVYFISADLQGAGLEGNEDIATFTTNKLENGGGILMSVNNVAKEFFVFPDASTTDAKATMSDDGAIQSQTCAKQ